VALGFAVVPLLAWTFGYLKPLSDPDTPLYLALSRQDLLAILGSIRTAGYPLFLKAAAGAGIPLKNVPFLQLLAHLGACLVLWRGLKRFGMEGWSGAAAALATLLSVLNDADVSYVMSDSLGRSAALTVVGLLLSLAGEAGGWSRWTALAAAVFLTYQVRPNYVFLVGFVPVALAALRVLLRTGGRRSACRGLAMAGAATLLPFLLFCTLRLALFGYFELAPFGGYSLAGVATEMLSAPEVQQGLPERWRPLASQVQENRRTLNIKDAITERGTDFARWRDNYNDDLWKALLPVLDPRLGGRVEEINQEAFAFARAVIRCRPGLYASFVAYNFLWGAIVEFPMQNYLLTAEAMVLAVVLLAALARGKSPWGLPGTRWEMAERAFAGLAVLYLAADLCIVSPLVPTTPRHLYAAGLLIPAAAALLIRRCFGAAASPPRIASSKAGP
jgi:hypothetical protein